MKLSAAAALFAISSLAAGAEFPRFEPRVINADAGTGLAIAAADIDGDGRVDIIGVSDKDANWYRNPGWEKKPISGKLKGSNVCVAAQDLDGDGLPELALGADWQPNNTKSGGALYILKRKGSLDEAWEARQLLAEEPTLHRIRWADVEGDNAPELIVSSLKGRDTTAPLHAERGARLFALRPPKDFMTGDWKEEAIDESLHVLHNILPRSGGMLAASAEGVTQFTRDKAGRWIKLHLAEGEPNPSPPGGCGEIKAGAIKGSLVMGTIEPFHGHQAVVYVEQIGNAGASEAGPLRDEWSRHVIDENLAQGHAVQFADFDGDGEDEMLVGFREPAGPGKRVGLNIYDLFFDATTRALGWEKHVIDDGGMACEDAVAADFNGDGKPDVAAFGRATHNIKLYENVGGAPKER